VAIVVQTVATALLAVSGEFVRLAVLANLSALLLYAACCAATWELRRRNVRQAGTPFTLPGVAWAPPLALLVLAWLLTSVQAAEWKVVLLVLAVAAVLFPLSRGRRRRLAEAAAGVGAGAAEPVADGAARAG
jgi:L-asparagine transporter-like permease